MNDEEINASIEKLAFKHQLAIEQLTESQLAEAIRQAILCGDFQRHISVNNNQLVTYAPFRKLKDAERERDEAREVLREIAEASHFDNIDNWTRNKAKEALNSI